MRIFVVLLIAFTFILVGCGQEDPVVVDSPDPSPPEDQQPEYRTRIRIRNVSGWPDGSNSFDVSKIILKAPVGWQEIDFGEVKAGQVTDYVEQWPLYSWPDFDLTIAVDDEIIVYTYRPTAGPGPILENGSYTCEIRGYTGLTIYIFSITPTKDETPD